MTLQQSVSFIDISSCRITDISLKCVSFQCIERVRSRGWPIKNIVSTQGQIWQVTGKVNEVPSRKSFISFGV